MAEYKPTDEEISQARRAHLSTLLSYALPLLPYITWPIAPIINLATPIYYWFKNRGKSYYAREQAKEALYMQALLAITWNLIHFGTQPWAGFATFAIGLFHFIFFLTAMIKTSYGKDFNYPFSIFQLFRKKKDFDEAQFELLKSDMDSGLKEMYKEILKSSAAKAKEIEAYSKKITDPKIKSKVQAINAELEKLFENFKNDPRDIKISKQFLSYYMDTTATILRKYLDLKSSGANSPEIQESLNKVESILDSILEAFRKHYAKLLENDVLELDTEIEVMQQTIKAEGF